MRRPAPLFVGLRYLRSQRGNQFASFVAGASVGGVALGVAALIVVLSVMNGFENELRTRLLSLTGHGTVRPAAGDEWAAVLASLRADPRIVQAAPVVEVEVMLGSGAELAGAVLTGLDAAQDAEMGGARRSLVAGELRPPEAGRYEMWLGRALALTLGVGVGDPVRVTVPYRDAAGRVSSRLREFTVSALFEVGLKDHDSVRAIVALTDASLMAGLGGGATTIRVTTVDPMSAADTLRDWAADWEGRGGQRPQLRDWTQDNASYFRAVRIEKTMMTLLLSLIVAVAAFNIVATLVMVVTDKRPGIAILRTLGFSRRTVVGIFAFQGLVIGWAGVLAGIALGIVLATNIETIAPALESLFGFEFMPADVYYVTRLPAELRVGDVGWIGGVALLMTGLATIYPALRAAAVAPAEVLRYE